MARLNPSTRSPLHVSRLVQLLQQLDISTLPVAQHNIAEKLGGLIDLSYSVTLSETLRGLPRTQTSGVIDGAHSLRAEMLEQRRKMMEFVITCCDTSPSNAMFPLPKLPADLDGDPAGAAQLFGRFYALQQSEMDLRISKLQAGARQALTSHSDRLARLATVDKAMTEILVGQTRRAFAVMPRLISQHFEGVYRQMELLQEDAEQGQQRPWFNRFVYDMQQLLLAELDIRLQPLLGLIEALEEDVGK